MWEGHTCDPTPGLSGMHLCGGVSLERLLWVWNASINNLTLQFKSFLVCKPTHVNSLRQSVYAGGGYRITGRMSMKYNNRGVNNINGVRGSIVVKARCYKPEGCGFDTR
jgi:hypothetical protein